MTIELTLTDHDGNPLDAPADLVLVLVGDGRPLARGVIAGPGRVTFAATLEGVKRLSVRGELPLP